MCLVNKFIHIVCLDAPAPPDYGGAIDMFYKIKSLAETGHQIILHYFDYNPARNVEGLQKYCREIFAYKRKSALSSLFSGQPYIVRSRINKELIKRLNADQQPVLLEGLHCSGIVPFLQSKQRIVIRMHNNESAYYRHLAKNEHKLLKRFYFSREATLLHRFQKAFDQNIPLAPLSEMDAETFRSHYGFQNVHFIPTFLPWQELKCKEGYGNYCLYHGNMAVSENEEAVRWLINNIFIHLRIPFVIAGKNISNRIKNLVQNLSHVTIINNPPDDELNALVQDAHIHLLPSLNKTGVKLKLLNALFNGRFCVTNSNGVYGSGIENGVFVADDAMQWLKLVAGLMDKRFSNPEITEREYLLSLYNNGQNEEKFTELWKHCL